MKQATSTLDHSMAGPSTRQFGNNGQPQSKNLQGQSSIPVTAFEVTKRVFQGDPNPSIGNAS